MIRRLVLAVLGTWSLLGAQEAPKIVSLEPANGAEVDAKKATKLVIVFDRAMDKNGFSLCGGGPSFPKLKGRPTWQNDKTLVAECELEVDHQYELGINCQSAQNTRSAEGVPVASTPWSFTSLPGKLRPVGEQKQRNQQAFDVLVKALAERYSHRDLRVKDWKKLEKDMLAKVLAAKTDRGFAAAAAEALKPTDDLHLYLRIGEQTFGTGSRSVDALFRRPLIDREVKLAPAGPVALAGRTADGIGYLLIAGWTKELDPEVVGGAITELMDTKAMVIDVRPNSGGDESLAQRVAAWFVEGTKAYAKNRYRERGGKGGVGPMIERTVTGNPANRRYDHPIAVLTSRYVMSSNESFVLMMKQAKDCVVVGQPTFGSSGNPKPVELGNGVTAFIPTWQDLRLDGTDFEGQGLQPDVLVPCTAKELETSDPILAKALELLRGKVAKK